MTLINRLRTFGFVAKHLNLRKAAEELHVSEPSISQQLRLLGEDFGVKLHNKTSTGVALTEEGRIFLKDAETILLRVERLREKFRKRNTETETGSLTVGGTHGPSATLLPSALVAFKKKHPKVQIRLVTGSSRSIQRKVLAGEIEIAVISNVKPPPHFTSEPYGTMKSVLFAAADHPIAKKKELSLFDLAKVPLIIRGGRGGTISNTEVILQQLSDQGFKPDIAMRLDSSEGVKMAVRKKLGMGILYEDAVRISLRRGEFKLIKIPGLKMDGNLFIIYRPGKTLSSTCRDFLDLLRQWREKNRRKNMSRNAVALALYLCPLLESMIEFSSASDLLFSFS